MNPASLNLRDRLAHAVAKEHASLLLNLGEDFSRTDVETL
ncbi:hypothetical protein EKH55_5267 [Sinorhizobium alkalisoli]|nr:hypothetical protein EKH55_5267 [Sinorhizobium alkalisoli]